MLGQAHIALGDNIYYGGSTQSNVHIDMVLRDPTITLDGATIVENGKLKF
jgi:leucyl aminopeptidase (aminopeptidase T)